MVDLGYDTRELENDFCDKKTRVIVEFIRMIGLTIETCKLDEDTFLPGIKVDGQMLLVDESRLKYPGDLLHEAGHLAVTAADKRHTLKENVLGSAGAELASIAWSYAAALHLGLDPSLVFHDGGYKGWSKTILDNFSKGRYFGVPLLDWFGLTADPNQARNKNVEPFPHMLKWLRD